jgi:hypothetical protein
VRTHFDYGLTINPVWVDDQVPPEGIIFNFTYFIFINLILTAIITGIILDTFATLRSKDSDIKKDTLDRCFICNIDRDDFDKLNLDFNEHIKKEHYMWSYLFFRVYLSETDKTDMTG